jgi:hypothetical protein
VSIWEALLFGGTFCAFLFLAAVLFCVVSPHSVAELIGEARQAALMRTRFMRAAVAWHSRKTGTAEL